MKQILFILTWMPALLYAGGLPKTSDAMLADVQRIGVAIDLADYPIRQREIQSVLDLPAMELLNGDEQTSGDTNWLYAITDPNDVAGYYGIRITIKKPSGTPPKPEDEVLSAQVLYIVKCRGQESPDHLTFVCEPMFPAGGIGTFKAMMKKEGASPAAFSRKLIGWINDRKVPNQNESTHQQ